MSGLATGKELAGKTGALITLERDVGEYVRKRAIDLLGASPKQMFGKCTTPYDAPWLETAGANAYLDPANPGRWFFTANATEAVLQLGRVGGSGVGFGATVKDADLDTGWYVACSIEITDAPIATTTLGVGFRNQYNGAFDGVLGVRGASSLANIVFYGTSGGLLTGPAFSLNTRYFCEAVRKGGVTRLLVNGVQYASGNTYPLGSGTQSYQPSMLWKETTAVTKRGLADLFAQYVQRDIGLP